MITEGKWVSFVSPEDGRTYTGLVKKVSRDGIAKIRYQHNYFGELHTQHEYLNTLRLTLTEAPEAFTL